MARGGIRPGAGRKPKAEEQKALEAFSKSIRVAHEKHDAAIRAGKPWAIKLAFEYYYGKPRQQVDVTSGGEQIQPNAVITTISAEELQKLVKK